MHYFSIYIFTAWLQEQSIVSICLCVCPWLMVHTTGLIKAKYLVHTASGPRKYPRIFFTYWEFLLCEYSSHQYEKLCEWVTESVCACLAHNSRAIWLVLASPIMHKFYFVLPSGNTVRPVAVQNQNSLYLFCQYVGLSLKCSYRKIPDVINTKPKSRNDHIWTYCSHKSIWCHLWLCKTSDTP